MTRKDHLTPRQQEILQLIAKRIADSGSPPTRAEIAQTLGFASANAAEEHLRALVRKGAIDLLPGTSRGIRIKVEGFEKFLGFNPNRAQTNSQTSAFALQGQNALCLPLIGRVSAGSPILAQEHIDQNYYVESSLFSKTPDYLLKVRGMSMRDAGIMDGDLLAVQANTEARDGQIIVARIGDDVTVKRMRRKSGCIELHPENPDYSVIIVQAQESFSIEGIAVGLIRKQVF